MPDLFPFPGLRYKGVAPDRNLAAVTAPPYDVIDEEGRARLEAAHPRNAVHLILPRDVEPGDRYRRAAETFEQWRADGTLTADPPHLYAYRMAFTDGTGRPRRMTGVVGALALSPPGDGMVLPHERTLPKAKSDRLELLRSVRANLEPIWGLSLAGGLSDLFEPAIAAGGPAASCFDEDGAEHCLFPIDADRVAAIQAAVAGAPLVIADGHHRYETALAYQAERRAAGLDDPGAGRIMMLVVELAEDQLVVRPIHRLLTGIGDDFRNRLSQVCQVIPLGRNSPAGVRDLVAEMDRTGSMGLVHEAGLALLTVKPAALAAGLDALPEALRDVDSALLEAVFDRVGPPGEIEYRNDALTVAGLVEKGRADAAVLLRAVSVAQIEAVAEAGLRMPQKTTFFQPKPLTGLVFRALDLG
ncbi:MAG TPA: DUF1015 domain-containing protein [Acidimicrobiia bacterium]|nr:DUF1015 domain-containing protein [Acidimicrobiia bacterium]